MMDDGYEDYLYFVGEMDQITENIYIGDDVSAVKPWLLRKHNISAVLTICQRRPNKHEPHIEYYWVPLEDGKSNQEDILNLAANTLKDLIGRNHTVLVHCIAGISRSVSVVALHLARALDGNRKIMVGFIKGQRKCANPHYLLERQVDYLLEQQPRWTT